MLSWSTQSFVTLLISEALRMRLYYSFSIVNVFQLYISSDALLLELTSLVDLDSCSIILSLYILRFVQITLVTQLYTRIHYDG